MAAFMQKIAEVLRLARLEKRWQKAARILAIVVVFCTTYMLILPAITMENRANCGMSEHTHRFSCYLDDEILICGIPEHEHSDACFIDKTTDGNVTDGNVTDGNIPAQEQGSEQEKNLFDRIMLFATPSADIDYSSDLTDFLVDADILDIKGNEIEDGGLVYIGEHYSIVLEFREDQVNWKQFEYDSEGYLTYKLPSNFNFDHFGANEWRDINFTYEDTGIVKKVGVYHIDDDGTLRVKFDKEENGVDFIDNYTNASFRIRIGVTVANTQSGTSTEIDFGNKIKVEIDVKENASLNLEKTAGKYYADTNQREYSIRVEATDGMVKDLVIDDEIWENHYALRDTIVVTDLNGNIINPQPTVSDHPKYNEGVEEGFSLSGFPDINIGEGFIITYRTQLYDYVLSEDEIGMWNGVSAHGKDNEDNPVGKWAYSDTKLPIKKLKKNGKQVVIKDANGNQRSVIEWNVAVRNSMTNMNGTLVIDTLGDGLQYYTGKDITVKRFDDAGNEIQPDVSIPWNQVAVVGSTMSFALPEGYSYSIVYYTMFNEPAAGEKKEYTNSVKTTINGKEEQAGSVAGVVGFVPNVKKSASGTDGEYAYFTIESDIPPTVMNLGKFYINDYFDFWHQDMGFLYIENKPQDLVVKAVTESGQTIIFTPYVEGGPTENTYILDSPAGGQHHYSFNILFNTSDTDINTSKWMLNENAKLTVTYKIPFDAKSGTEWSGELGGELTLEDILMRNKQVTNHVYFSFTDGVAAEDNVGYEYYPIITKKSVVNDDATIDYTVVFHNTVPGSGGNVGYLQTANPIIFTDTFDERLEYVEDSLIVTCYDPWSTWLWINKYKYTGEVEGNTINASADMFSFYQYNYAESGSSWRDYLANVSTYLAYCNMTNGGDHIFTYKLRVKEEYLKTTDYSKLYLDNTAEIKWGTDGTSGPVTEESEVKTGLLDKEYEQDGSALDFKIHINPGALDILPGADTLTITDTMTNNLSVYWQSIKLFYEDEYGNWIDFDSPQSVYNFTVSYDPISNTLTFVVPDSLHIEIDYRTLITESGYVSVNNTVKIDGKAAVTDIVDAQLNVKEHDSGASGYLNSMTLLKHSGITGENLPNAVLALYGPVIPDNITVPAGTPATVEGHGKTLYYIGTYTTGPDGTALMENQYLAHGNLYALVEVVAPTGYILPDEPTYFYFYENADLDDTVQTVTTIITVPNYVEGGYLLPETGGMGTHILYITGGLLMFLSVVFLLGKRKRAKKRRSDFFGA